jgi:chemotaxis protein CheZ
MKTDPAMMPARKPFRIEALLNGQTGSGETDPAARRHSELMNEIASLRSVIRPAAEISKEISTETLDALRREMAEAGKLKAELDAIHEAIERTKREIATLHENGFETPQVSVTGELDAIVTGTENATNAILAAAEHIDEHAGALGASMRNAQQRGHVSDIQDSVVSIFEACNFQDLTGQRITKVVGTLKFVEERINHMIQIWGGMEKFEGIVPEARDVHGDRALLNGPGLDSDPARASQADIDALFD